MSQSWEAGVRPTSHLECMQRVFFRAKQMNGD